MWSNKSYADCVLVLDTEKQMDYNVVKNKKPCGEILSGGNTNTCEKNHLNMVLDQQKISKKQM